MRRRMRGQDDLAWSVHSCPCRGLRGAQLAWLSVSEHPEGRSFGPAPRVANLDCMDTSGYAVELSFVDRSTRHPITEQSLKLEPGTPVPSVDDAVYLTERDTDYSTWIVKSRDFMYLMPETNRSVLNLRITLHCDRQA